MTNGFKTLPSSVQLEKPVKAILRSVSKAPRLREIGCEVAVADVLDYKALAQTIGDAAAVQMRQGIESIARALEQTRPTSCSTLCRIFEERLSKLQAHKVLLRSAEHIQGWSRAISKALKLGRLASFQDPLDMPFSTVFAPGVGVVAADIFLRPASGVDVKNVHVERERRYSASDGAKALGEILRLIITAQAVLRSQWKTAFESLMSASLAELLIKADDAQNKGGLVDVEPNANEVRYGTTELPQALRPLIQPQ
ncbi:hypothetical protein BBK36DRAFT_1171500 [Trichoderma citrinoviride]|uniref:Uncharacterized protein n=1 Tax=Trichoderma citrinoviride TaxID=58853 RepID=A0A2T4B1Q3_9HYPO|nr:hypothetical protein BBK36DRAFT_1171500 [Trichoderma citrinoviride]PTB63256.1 hypothetical protein BBK36DRAFT_1171500 [Trichoderma citrinoviride]